MPSLSPRVSSAYRLLPLLPASTTTTPASLSPNRRYASKKNKGSPKAEDPDEDGDVTLVYGLKNSKKGKTKAEPIGDARPPGKEFDVDQLRGNMDKSIERMRTSLNGVVARVGRVSPSKDVFLCARPRAPFFFDTM
jgi:hypothetical protein